jgi:hypothetical protein
LHGALINKRFRHRREEARAARRLGAIDDGAFTMDACYCCTVVAYR